MMAGGTLAAVDPGREKCGFAVLDAHGTVLFQKVIETLNLVHEINDKYEYRTTDMAKRAYWQARPPCGWRRLLPVSMLVPPEPVDDFVAIILARRFLEGAASGDV